MSRLKCVYIFLTVRPKYDRKLSWFVKHCNTDCKTVDVKKGISLVSAEARKQDLKVDFKIRVSDSAVTSSEYKNYFPSENKSVLEPSEEDVSHIVPKVSPTFNFAAYANNSYTLQQLVKLGVELHKLENKKEVCEFIIKLDFEKDIKNHLRYVFEILCLTIVN